jgi:hypothetical protein
MLPVFIPMAGYIFVFEEEFFISFQDSSPNVWALLPVKAHMSCSVHTIGAISDSFIRRGVVK